jgi:hypothetical protein
MLTHRFNTKSVRLMMALLLGASVAAGSLVHSAKAEVDYTDREQYNRQHDPDIDRGYKENQDYNRNREDREERTSRGEIPDPYSVDTSGQDSVAGKHGK